MSGDLVSLRMLVIAATRPDQELWRQAASVASVPVDFAIHDPASAAGALAKTGADICVVDANLPETDKAAVIGAARAAQPAPLVFISAAKNSVRFDGIDGMLSKPANVEEARKLVEICIRAKIPTRVLIVDDSSTMRGIVRKILSASHFALDIHEAAEGTAAINQLCNGNFGMVFLDYNMPGLNGFETLSEMKRECPNVAVVMMTSTLDDAIAARAHAAGALAFLKKPFYPADVDVVLERFYGLNRPVG
ncbi:MAG: response regulator [Deltaproteobacteria bacterium]|nr:response regulator [Deltaproteobacteria bacterium]